MSTVVAIGADSALEGFALAGVQIIVAEADADIAAAWDRLNDEVGLVILSAPAAQLLEARLDSRPDLLTVVMP